jgi:predicted RNase H-like HicB family nuclease
MNKHTPGPWKASTSPQGWSYTIYISQDESAEYTPDWSDVAYIIQTCEGERKSIQEANARLIAAAPDLLEALQYVMVAHGEQLDHAFQMAQDAIAKATGVV